MKVFKFTPEGIENCSVIAWIHTDLGTGVEPIKYPAIIICPGGGYARVTTRETEPVANPYFAA